MLAPIARLFISVCLFILAIVCALLAWLLPAYAPHAWWPICFLSGVAGAVVHPDMGEIDKAIQALNEDNARR